MTNFADAFAIQQLVHRFSFAASTLDATGVANTFAEDGVLVGFAQMVGRAEPETVGRDAIRALFEEILPGVEFIHHMSLVGKLEVTGDTARAEVMASEHVRWRRQAISIFGGRYTDELARTPEGWLIARRSLTPVFVSQPEGVVTTF